MKVDENTLYELGIYHIPNKEDWVALIEFLELVSVAGTSGKEAEDFWNRYETDFCVHLQKSHNGNYTFQYSSREYYEEEKEFPILSLDGSKLKKKNYEVELL